MRITGGSARGRLLRTPRGLAVRPTADRVREALFDILGSRVRGIRFLDCYAGTGAVGIEALSRGAAGAVFVERDPAVIRCLERNLDLAGFREIGEVRRGECLRVLRDLTAEGASFGCIFVDPPYESREADRVLFRISGSRLLAAGGTVVLEGSSRRAVPATFGRLTCWKRSEYGDSALSFLGEDP